MRLVQAKKPLLRRKRRLRLTRPTRKKLRKIKKAVMTATKIVRKRITCQL